MSKQIQEASVYNYGGVSCIGPNFPQKKKKNTVQNIKNNYLKTLERNQKQTEARGDQYSE